MEIRSHVYRPDRCMKREYKSYVKGGGGNWSESNMCGKYLKGDHSLLQHVSCVIEHWAKDPRSIAFIFLVIIFIPCYFNSSHCS